MVFEYSFNIRICDYSVAISKCCTGKSAHSFTKVIDVTVFTRTTISHIILHELAQPICRLPHVHLLQVPEDFTSLPNPTTIYPHQFWNSAVNVRHFELSAKWTTGHFQPNCDSRRTAEKANLCPL